ncbi:MAG: hypothetical protein M1821_009269 [Bathelium mastoideum]|nr:MAG: hypothetical protein M1821_009269 [Bathelium mastoideum]
MSLRSGSSSPAQEDALQKLSQRIGAAVDNTGTDLSNRFLPILVLNEILCHESLLELFEELFDANAPEAERAELETYAEKTLQHPSRISILALFLYDNQRTACLELFKQWLSDTSCGLNFPSDDDLPLSQDKADALFSGADSRYILDHQAVFKPFTIHEGLHQELPFLKCRLPFVGQLKPINEGASGAVYEVTIAAGHWQYDKFGTDEITAQDHTLAVKVFEKRTSVSAESATQDFENERDFLAQLKEANNSNKMIVLDLGSIVEKDDQGEPIYYMFFPLAVCNLDEFLKGEEFRGQVAAKSIVISKAVDLLEALDFLHTVFKSLHLDIKPDNILVFTNSNVDGGFSWKFADFNLSMNKIKKPASDRHLERSIDPSDESTVPSKRAVGIYQAPEIQRRDESKASEGSDVWSMGCILLKLLAFLFGDGPPGVEELENKLDVNMRDQGMKRKSFYVTPAMHEWPDAPQSLSYLGDLGSARGSIEGSMPDAAAEKMEAAVHPLVIKWSEVVYDNAQLSDPAKNRESQPLKTALEIIFKEVLSIDRESRIKAKKLEKSFSKVRDDFQHLERPEESGSDQPDSPTTEQTTVGSIDEQLNHRTTAVSRQSESESASPRGSASDDVPSSHNSGAMGMSDVTPQPVPPIKEASGSDSTVHSELCSVISNGLNERLCELLQNPSTDPNALCLGCKEYPIHIALRGDHQALRALLTSDFTIDTNIESPSSFQTPVEIACERSGDYQALQLLFNYRKTPVGMSEELYKACKEGCSQNVKSLLQKKYQSLKNSPPRRYQSSDTGSDKSAGSHSSSSFLPRFR